MTRRRGIPGVQVSAGRMRVDAARAISKLREYQLEEKTGWVLEAIRAAVASGATRLELAGDANDVWLRWEGEPWPAEDLPKLFDELVSPQVSGERQHVRLLAMAVNSALGLEPSFVDVIAVESERKAARARYTPDVLVPPSDELGEAPLHRLTVEEIAPPSRSKRGMIVHLRRKLGLDVLGYLLRREPRELVLARLACGQLAVPMVIRKEELGRHLEDQDVVRVALGGDLDGFLAVVDPAPPGDRFFPGELHAAERGVVLERVVWAVAPPAVPGATSVPLRLFVDAPQLPANAARSKVRQEAHPISAAKNRAAQLMPELIAALVAKLQKQPASRELAGRALLDRIPRRARAAALAIFGGVGARWSWRLPLAMAALESIPLVCDAAGKLGPVTRLWRPFVYDGSAPLPAELGPWLEDLLWIPPGDASEALVPKEHFDAPATREHVRWARRQLEAKQTFLARPAGEPTITWPIGERKARLTSPLGAKLPGSCVPEGVFHGLRGEVSVLCEGQGGELILFYQGREIERVKVASAIPFAVAIEAPFAPVELYRAVVRDAAFARAEQAMRGAVIRAMEAVSIAERGEPVPAAMTPKLSVERGEYARTVRAAAALIIQAGMPMGGPLLQAKAWRGFDGQWHSLAELSALDAAAIGTAAPDARREELPRGRLMLEADDREHEELGGLQTGKLLVRYERQHLERRHSAAALAKLLLAEGRSCALALETPTASVAIAPWRESRVSLYHRGVLLERRKAGEEIGDFEILVEHDEAIPDDEWEAAVESGVEVQHVAEWKIALVRALARALCGDVAKELHGDPRGEGEWTLEPELGPILLEALMWRSAEELFGAELAERLREAPLFAVTGRDERWSARDLAREFPVELPYLPLPEGQKIKGVSRRLAAALSGGDLELMEAALDGMTALLAEPINAELALKLGGQARLVVVEDELKLRVGGERRELRRAAHLKKPPQPLFRDGEVHVAVEVPGGGERLRCSIALALPVPGTAVADIRSNADRATGMVMCLFVEKRLLKRMDFLASVPVYAAVESAEELLDESYQGLPAELVNELLGHIERAVPRLLLAVAEAQPEQLTVAGSARSLLLRAFRDKLVDGETRAWLRRLVSFATVQGGRVTLAELPRQLSVAGSPGEWLGSEDPQSASEAPILLAPPSDYELRKLLEVLHDGWLSDVTESVKRVQKQRRHQRGLMPRPVVAGAEPLFTRKLEMLGDLGRMLAPGELALVDEPQSVLLLHGQGVLREQLAMPEVLPAVKLAVEDAAQQGGADHSQVDPALSLSGALARLDDEHQELATQAQRLTMVLLQQIVEDGDPEELPAWVRRSLRIAVLTRRMVVPLMDVPLFETVRGDKVAWCDVAEQLELFGDVWAFDGDAAPEGEPLDGRRLMLRLPVDEQELARQNGRQVVEAAEQLRLDEVKRENLAKQRAHALDLPGGLRPLAVAKLEGDGVEAPRGVVAILPASQALRRGLLAHRELVALARIEDDCVWPTLALVDDARLPADRIMERAVPGPELECLRAAVRAASARALADLVRIPDDVLASRRVVAQPITFRAGRGALHGALWLRGAPAALFEQVDEQVKIFEGEEERSWERAAQLGLAGELHVYAPPGDAGKLALVDEKVTEVCREAHRELVKQLLRAPGVDPDVLTAHVAVAVGRGDPLKDEAAAAAIRFSCFGPEPLDVAELAHLFRKLIRVPVADRDGRGSRGYGDSMWIFDDGSHTARVLLPLLGGLSPAQMMQLQARAKAANAPKPALPDIPPPSPPPPPAPSPPVSHPSPFPLDPEALRAMTAAAAEPVKLASADLGALLKPAKSALPDEPSQPRHPLEPMLAEAAERLITIGLATFPFMISFTATSPMVKVFEGVVFFAGQHPQLRAIAAAHSAKTAWHEDAIDALVAHVIALLHAATHRDDDRYGVTTSTEQHALTKLLLGR